MTRFSDPQGFMESIVGRSMWADVKIGDKLLHPEHGR